MTSIDITIQYIYMSLPATIDAVILTFTLAFVLRVGCVLGLSHHPSRNLLASGALERNSVIKIWEYQDPV